MESFPGGHSNSVLCSESLSEAMGGIFGEDTSGGPHGEVELMHWADTLVQDPDFFEEVRRRTSASIFPQVVC